MTARQTLGTALVLLAGLVMLSGCDPDKRTLAFSHNLHVKENGMACADCHGSGAEGRYILPTHKSCSDCHSDWIDTKTINEKTCGKCHKQKDPKDLAYPVATAQTNSASMARGIFVHTAVLSNRCADCHGAILDPKVKVVAPLTPGDRIKIRTQAHAWGMDCKACHADLNRDTPPPSHQENWTKRHGALGAQSDNACGQCHREQACRDCHQVTKPQSHNNLWRLKTHGMEASFDRARCLVCHQQDSCTACHETTSPTTHTAGWRDNHCKNCHTSTSGGGGTGCAVCHPNVGIGSSHPDPHGPGWRQQHCFSCHEGSPETQQCAVCHAGATGGLQQIHHGFWPSVHNRFYGQNVDCYYCHMPASAAKVPKAHKHR